MTERRAPREFLAGVLAAIAMTVAMGVLRLATGVLSLPEILGEGIIRILPGELFSAILDVLQHAAKPTLVAGILLGQLAVGGLLGRLYGRAPSPRRALAIAAVTWVVFGVVVFPLLGLGVFASVLSAGPVFVAVSMAAVFLLYAGALVWTHRLLLPAAAGSTSEAPARERRALLARLGLGVAAVAVAGYGWRALSQPFALLESPARRPASPDDGGGSGAAAASAAPRITFSPAPGEPASGAFAVRGLSPEVTPTATFYTVSKNFWDPAVKAADWRLTIDGLVERPLTLDYEAMRQLPAVSDFYTLQCISNPIGGDLWGNAYWRGVRLRDLLLQAGLKPGVRKVVLHAADDYTDSISLERAFNEGTIVAYEMNGAPLPKEHGYPARLLVPGIYGMKNVKWLTRIELVDYDFKGYWMQRGWSDAAPYKTSSRIDVPTDRGSTPSGAVAIGGVAFAGDRGVQAVEYSLDDGQTWERAELKPALSPNAWQLWVARPTLAPGRYTVKVRAIDGQGEIQSGRNSDPFPDGASGYHTITILAG